MYITLESDYAVRILIYMCKKNDRLGARAISNATGVTQRFALKILGKLTIGGIIKSYKGIYGGYVINKDPSEISLLDVIEIFEGEYCFSRCLKTSSDNKKEAWSECDDCKVKNVYSKITDLVRSELKQVTFDKLI